MSKHESTDVSPETFAKAYNLSSEQEVRLSLEPRPTLRVYKSQPLCLTCQSIFRDWETWKDRPNSGMAHYDKTKYSTHHDRSQDLCSATVAGCAICRILYEQLVTTEWLEGNDQESETLTPFTTYELGLCIFPGSPEDAGSTGWTICVNFDINVSKKEGRTYGEQVNLGLLLKVCIFLTVVVGLASSFPDPRANMRLVLERMAYSLDDYTGSEISWSFINGLVEQCLGTHRECPKRTACDWKLTRLIDLSDVGLGEAVRVVQKDECESGAPYIALSHCWGGKQSLRLLSANQLRLSEKIFLTTLPKTWRDAVLICKKLECQYLWIDSLCIIQDSMEDWRREAAEMGKVYANAFYTIAASGAQNADEGLFFKRQPAVLRPAVVHIDEFPVGTQAYVVYRPQFSTVSVMDSGPLAQRAWTLQEQLLSPRVISFGRQQLAWRCRHAEVSEQFRMPTKTANIPIDRLFTAPNPHGVDREVDRWRNLVSRYSMGGLTKLEDKMIALSGIASTVQAGCGHSYAAGLWWHQKGDPEGRAFVRQLMWYTDGNTNFGEPSFRPRRYRAPTWSWASLEGCTLMPDWHFPPRLQPATLAELSITPVDEQNTTGEVSAGFVRVRGKVTPIDLILQKPGSVVSRGTVTFQVGGEALHDTAAALIDEQRVTESLTHSGKRPYCLPLHTNNHQMQIVGTVYGTVQDGHHLGGLLLNPVDSSTEEAVYTRLGVFQCFSKEIDELLMQPADTVVKII